MISQARNESDVPRQSRNSRGERGVAALFLVVIIMTSILMGVTLSHWISVQRRGAMHMNVAVKESMLAQSALQETRLRFVLVPSLQNCPAPPGNTFTYFIDRSTVSVTIDCIPYP